jgi:hypothetical protein
VRRNDAVDEREDRTALLVQIEVARRAGEPLALEVKEQRFGVRGVCLSRPAYSVSHANDSWRRDPSDERDLFLIHRVRRSTA